MKIIEKVEIKHFRSFLGTTQNDKAEILDVKDLNIFSGSNDSGKSNILRALNLFFNGEIDSRHQFNFDTEFSMLKKDKTQKVIEIKIYFVVNKRKFSISKFYNRNGYRNFEYRFIENGEEIIIDSRPDINARKYGDKGKKNADILKKERGFRRAATGFISSISFSYVPAIRDERFFSHLYGKVILQIKANEEKEIEDLTNLRRKIKNYVKTLKNKSEKKSLLENLQNEIWRDEKVKEIDKEIADKSSLKQSIEELENQINKFSGELFASAKFLDSEFKIGNNLKEFFESFDIGTGEQKEISLRLRGDGIQAKFIPEMLDFLDSIQESKKSFIWGFEEPENSGEYINQQLLAEKFKTTFSNQKQIFITTHSEEFLSMYDGLEIEKEKRKANLYHVKKVSNNEFKDFSIITLFDVETQTFDFASVRSDIEQHIGSSLIRAKYSKELKEKEQKFIEEKEILEAELQQAEQEFKQKVEKLRVNFPERVFICEDKNAVKTWETLFKRNGIEDITVISSKGCTLNTVEIWISENIKRNSTYKPKVFRSLDRDGYTENQVEFLEKKLNERNGKDLKITDYKIKFLPVNELENFAVLIDDYFTDEIIENRKTHLEDKLIQTIDSNLKQNNAKFNDDTDLFNIHKNSLLRKNMEREAEPNKKKFYPGKELKKLKPNFNPERFLRNLSPSKYPEELTQYLSEIKTFFEIQK
jgi:hypothetical protein